MFGVNIIFTVSFLGGGASENNDFFLEFGILQARVFFSTLLFSFGSGQGKYFSYIHLEMLLYSIFLFILHFAV